jgi:alpha-N-arabinofuranosidase
MIYGHFIEHFHRQIYGGIFDPGNPLSDSEGFRTDVIDAMKRIKVPIMRWPGGCFVSAHHWRDGVGPQRTPAFDKAWRVEESNSFGTDEYIAFCRKAGCEPYICTNAGSGSPEEMSDWVEYCNLTNEGPNAKQRIANGHKEPYNVKYWSIGNENYGAWEIGAKTPKEWGRYAAESAKMMKRVDPKVELSAAALADLDWNVKLLQNCGNYLDWISIHQYWDRIHETNDCAGYAAAMACTNNLDKNVLKVKGLLEAMGLKGRIRIAFDEWNLRGWYHPRVHGADPGLVADEYIKPRDLNDINSLYTMADAVFTACFFNMCNRNCDVVGMANFAPVVNTRGCIYTHKDGIVLRPAFYVFEMYAGEMGETVLDTYTEEMPVITVLNKEGETVETNALDLLASLKSNSANNGVVLAAVNKDPKQKQKLEIEWNGPFVPVEYTIHTLSGKDIDAYNDIGHTEAKPASPVSGGYDPKQNIELGPHSVNLIYFR